MVSLDDIRDQLRDTLVALKAATVDAVPADELFFVRDAHGDAHVAGSCVTSRPFPLGAKWESATGSILTNLSFACLCVRESLSLGSFDKYVGHIDGESGSSKLSSSLPWPEGYISLRFTFPAVFEVWERVNRVYTQFVLADPRFLEKRANEWRVWISQLPPTGVGILQYRFPEGLEVFPNGVSTVVPWVTLPEEAALRFWAAPDEYTLRGVEGWPVERVEVVSTLIRDSGSQAEALAAFKIAKQLVP